jgi:hypothetical protein
MDKTVKRLADALRMAEKAHAEYEKQHAFPKHEWPEFYAQWLIDNTHIWAHDVLDCPDGSCEIPQGGDFVG